MTDKEKQAVEKVIDFADTHISDFENEEDVQYIEIVSNLVETQAKELEKKDKMIDLMIEEYEYNVRINVKNFCEEELRKDSCIQDCKICIKEYFERQVEEDGNKNTEIG